MKVKTLLLALASISMFCSCSMIPDDLDDCPTGLYVNFVYDFNTQRADMFKDHVGAVTLYVFDESNRLVQSRTVSDTQLSVYGFNIHFSENELAPGHQYRLKAIALQKDWNAAIASKGAKYRFNSLQAGQQMTDLNISLDRKSATPYAMVDASAPFDTLWHTLITMPAENATQPAKTKYHLKADGTVSTNHQDLIEVKKGEPTYATVSLIRDTKHLNISLYELDNPSSANIDKYEVFIVDRNGDMDCNNKISGDSLVYRPYAAWNTTYDNLGVVANGTAAHFDLNFNRLIFTPNSSQNALLVVRNRQTGENIAMLNLPYILCQGRIAYEMYAYEPQEYLDREYDYRLELFLKNGRWEEEGSFISVCIDVLSWAKRIQYIKF